LYLSVIDEIRAKTKVIFENIFKQTKKYPKVIGFVIINIAVQAMGAGGGVKDSVRVKKSTSEVKG